LDRVIGDKYKQNIQFIYIEKRNYCKRNIKNYITCLQRDEKSLKFYYSEKLFDSMSTRIKKRIKLHISIFIKLDKFDCQ
jgi:hypothetical protein